MSDVIVNGISYKFYDAQRLFDLLDVHADGVYEEGHLPSADINGPDSVSVHFSGMVFQYKSAVTLMSLLDERADEVSEV